MASHLQTTWTKYTTYTFGVSSHFDAYLLVETG